MCECAWKSPGARHAACACSAIECRELWNGRCYDGSLAPIYLGIDLIRSSATHIRAHSCSCVTEQRGLEDGPSQKCAIYRGLAYCWPRGCGADLGRTVRSRRRCGAPRGLARGGLGMNRTDVYRDAMAVMCSLQSVRAWKGPRSYRIRIGPRLGRAFSVDTTPVENRECSTYGASLQAMQYHFSRPRLRSTSSQIIRIAIEGG